MSRTHSQWIGHALWANVLNPKLSIFFHAFLPKFVDTTSSQPAAAMIRLSLVFMALTFAVFALYGVFVAQMRDRVLQRPAVLRWLRRSFAAAFVLLGARLARTRR
ncbi:LysE family translocator [Silanimonas lenta]|uniref:LysE family translocator n=1 Tax=Silanimonas lenta TaxID=265429 RepID=UPI0003F6A212|nr:LysE family transporter [Silanimonas lenta]